MFAARTAGAPWTFRYKLFVVFTILTAIISVTFTAIYTCKEVDSYRRHSAEKALLLATILADSARLALYARDLQGLESLARKTARYPGVNNVTVVDTDGNKLVQIGGAPIRREKAVVADAQVPLGLTGKLGDPFLGDWARSNGSVGTVTVEMDSRELHQAIRSTVLTSALTAFFLWVGISVVSYIIVNWITRSLRHLTIGIRAIRGGDYNFRIPPTDGDELGTVADAINELAAELLKRDGENQRLQQDLINSMKLQMSEERKKMMAKLIQTNRMTSLGLLVSSMAHEINTPNGAIKLAGQQMAKAWRSTVAILDRIACEENEDFVLGGGPYSLVREETLRATEVVSRSSERIERVIQDLRAFSAGGRSDLRQDVNIGEIVSDAVAIIRAHGRYGNITIDNQAKTEVPPVVGNRHQLGQVVTNLLLNGMQSISAGRPGTVTIYAEFESLTKEVVVQVRDNGKGIPTEHFSQLLEPFFSTRLDKGGSGLGLYISDFIIKEHCGSIEFASQVGEGTTVTVRIPAHLP